MKTRSPYPLFAIFRPNVVNHIDEGCGLGASVFAQAIDNLKGVDLAFNNLCRDFKLGGKKVFYDRTMVQRDGENAITPDDICQQLFLDVGERMSPDRPMLVQEFNPSLRVEENTAGVQAQLDYLSFRCGLGTRRYRFERTGQAVTATQYMGDQQELIQHAARHAIVLEQAIKSVARAALWVGKELLGESVTPECEIAVKFDDGVFEDRGAEFARRMQLLAGGVIASAQDTPETLTEPLQGYIEAIKRQTGGELQNITQSLGFAERVGGGKTVFRPIASAYQHALDVAHLQVQSGAQSYTYTESELKAIDPPPFDYDGKTYGAYEATQRQRFFERSIRGSKTRLAGLSGAMEKAPEGAGEELKAIFTAEAVRLRRLREGYKKFSEAAGMRQQNERAREEAPVK